MDLACKHGYHECKRCVNEADERARQVAQHYTEDLKRDRARRSSRAGQNMYHHPEDHVPGGEALQYKPTVRVVLRKDGGLPTGRVYDFQGREKSKPPRCECGSRLQAKEALQTGQCHYCRNGKQPPWESRCECGSGLMGRNSIETGKCSNCRLDELDW